MKKTIKSSLTGSLTERIEAIKKHPLRILNASVGRSYEALFDVEKFGWTGINHMEFEGLKEAGLYYDEKTNQITGVPTLSGDVKIKFKFKLEGQPADAALNEKEIVLIINPDPKSLWKNLESDKNDPYWKEDDKTEFAKLCGRHLIVSSKRGRSHANVGSFREDDYAFAELADEWCVVVVSDGAGSARLSRKGSDIACKTVVEQFQLDETAEQMRSFDALLTSYNSESNADAEKKINLFVYNTLGKVVFNVHKKLEQFAAAENFPLKDLAATLVFTVFKKYPFGYALLSFGVGDCPMAVLDKKVSEVNLLNWIDVGEYGGGTRFITMPEIFHNQKFSTRFTFKLVEDFSYLMLMSDGIYDPKFVVESSLPDIKKWRSFLNDLSGQNDDHVAVELKPGNENIKQQLSSWMDFWSPGNHDDRTLAIVF